MRVAIGKEVDVTKFTISGDFEQVSAQLKAALEASDASFNANLEALSKSLGTSPMPAAPAAGSHDSAGWALATNGNRLSNRGNADALRGRIRSSRRFSPSR